MHLLTRTRLCGALVLALAACQRVQVTPIGPASARLPVLTDSVRLFFSRDAVPFRYDEIALLSMDADWLAKDKEDIYLSLRKKAGELGANAVIVASVDEKGASVLYTAGGLQGNALAVLLHLADTVARPR
jgi:hypothetical protein